MSRVGTARYGYVRALQLDGTYPNDAGAWSITCNRVRKGWGMLPAATWSPPRHEWPPREPPGLDQVAANFRVRVYTRITDVEECRRALRAMWPVFTVVPVTHAWFHVPWGRIERETEEGRIIQWHMVRLVQDLPDDSRFLFANSWHHKWGMRGFGTLSYDYFERRVIEAWIDHPLATAGSKTNQEEEFELRSIAYITPFGEEVYVLDVWTEAGMGTKDLAGWYISVVKPCSLDVQDFFVKPAFRRRGVARKMADHLRGLARFARAPLRVWVPHGDMKMDPGAVDAVARLLGVTLQPTEARWATHVGVERLETTRTPRLWLTGHGMRMRGARPARVSFPIDPAIPAAFATSPTWQTWSSSPRRLRRLPFKIARSRGPYTG